ncbi:MAG: hypothetical protein Q8Q94_02095 [bacterium]|nr:hypothetical protein [bacterium]
MISCILNLHGISRPDSSGLGMTEKTWIPAFAGMTSKDRNDDQPYATL